MSEPNLLHAALGVVLVLGGAYRFTHAAQLDRNAPDDPDAARSYMTDVQRQRRWASIAAILYGAWQLAIALLHTIRY